MFKNFAVLQPLSSGVTGVEVVPELDILLALLPAEEDLVAGEDGGEIDQAAIQVLDLDFTPIELEENLLDAGEGPDPLVDQITAEVAAWGGQGAEAFFGFVEFGAELDQFFEPLANLGQQRPSLFPRIMLLELHGHGPGFRKIGLRTGV